MVRKFYFYIYISWVRIPKGTCAINIKNYSIIRRKNLLTRERKIILIYYGVRHSKRFWIIPVCSHRLERCTLSIIHVCFLFLIIFYKLLNHFFLFSLTKISSLISTSALLCSSFFYFLDGIITLSLISLFWIKSRMASLKLISLSKVPSFFFYR